MESGRESMALADRVALLEADLMAEPFLGITDATRATSQTIHDLKLTIGYIRNTVALYKKRKSQGVPDAELEKGAYVFITPMECMVLAWRRGGHQEWQRIRKLIL